MKKTVSFLLAMALAVSMAVPASASLIKQKDAAGASGNKAKASDNAKTAPAKASADSGAFTGSTKLSQFLYKKLGTGAASIKIPKSYFNSGSFNAMSNEAFDAADEANMQNAYSGHIRGWNTSYDGSNFTLKPKYADSSAATRANKNKALKEKVDAILPTIITEGMTVSQKADAIQRYLAAHTTYDNEALQILIKNPMDTGNHTDSFTAYGVLINGKGVCQGYAKAYKVLADAAGLRCVSIFGATASGIPHSWNKVFYDGKWQVVDATNLSLGMWPQSGAFVAPATAQRFLVEGTQGIVDKNISKFQ